MRARHGSGDYRQIRPGGLRIYPSVFLFAWGLNRLTPSNHGTAHGDGHRTLVGDRADSTLSAGDISCDAHREVCFGVNVNRLFSCPRHVSGCGDRHTGRGGLLRPDDASLRIAHMNPVLRSCDAGGGYRYVVLTAQDMNPSIGGSGSPTRHGSSCYNGDAP